MQSERKGKPTRNESRKNGNPGKKSSRKNRKCRKLKARQELNNKEGRTRCFWIVSNL